MRNAILLLTAIGGMVLTAGAGDMYRLEQDDTLITLHRSDMRTFMALNARHDKPAVRALYDALAKEGQLVNYQRGDVVEVGSYGKDGIASIEGNGNVVYGYIAEKDLTIYLNSR